MLVSAGLRLANITTIGIDGVDTFQYTRIAERWSEGDYVFKTEGMGTKTTFYRPVAYCLYSLALGVFGDTDYAIKVLNILIDLINILLVFYLGKILINKETGLFSAVIYGMLPYVIDQSRMELLHIMSGMFFLISACCFAAYESASTRKKRFYLALAGSGVSLASNTHPVMLISVIGFVACIFISRMWSRLEKAFIKNLILDLAVFAGFFLIPYIIGIAVFGFDTVVNSLLSTGSMAIAIRQPDSSPLLTNLSYISMSLLKTLWASENSFIFLILFVISIPFIPSIFRNARGSALTEGVSRGMVFLFVSFSTFLFLAIVIFKEVDPRFFTPFIPIYVMYSFSFIYFFLDRHLLNRKEDIPVGDTRQTTVIKTYSFVASLIIVVLFSAIYDPATLKAHFLTPKPSMVREVYNVIGDNADSENKLLVMPHVFRHSGAFSVRKYFDGNVLYTAYSQNENSDGAIERKLYVTCKEPLDSFVKNNNIRFIFFSEMKQNRQTLEMGFRFQDDYLGCIETRADVYSIDKEYEYVMNYVRKNKTAKIVYKSDIGIIIDLKANSLITSQSRGKVNKF